jgi:hypothetical protein
MPERRLRLVRALGGASEADLVIGVARRNEQALQELRHRHAAALSVLACAIVREPASATRAVNDVFASISGEPGLVSADRSVRVQLAALVHERCSTIEHERSGVVSSPERIAVALIAFGDHTCVQAAERVGSSPAVVAERLRAFVVDPDHFTAFYDTDENAAARRVRRLRATT